MRSLHKTIIGGGFAALAVAGVAGSVAFACTPLARLSVNGATSIVTTPGSTVELKGTSFDRQDGPVVFAWNSDKGEVLGTATHVNMPATFGSGTTEAWITNVVIPADALPGSQYVIIAFQNKADGSEHLNQSVMVSIPRVAGALNTSNQPSGAPAVSPALTPAPATVTGTAATPSAAPFIAPAPQATAGGFSATPAVSPSLTAPVATAEPAGTPAAATPATPSVDAEEAAALRQPLAIPAPADIWSGLDRSAPATTLLDAPVPTSSDSQLPVGVILLGLGALALAGTGAAAAQQRRVLVKANQEK